MTQTLEIPDAPAIGREQLEHARPERAPLLGPVVALTAAALGIGLLNRQNHDLVPHEGAGYALGVIGLAMMTLLLLYPLRKRWRPLRRVGRIQRWFQIHMALGLLGPTAILYHANFSLGSLNANVAVACMLIVSGSGVVGRFIYTRIHYEYLGHIATLAELRHEAEREGHWLHALARTEPGVQSTLDDFRAACLLAHRSAVGRAASLFLLGWRERAARRRIIRLWRTAGALETQPGRSTRDARRAVKAQLRAIRRVGEFSTYERLFALWHAFHLPFCVVLFAAATVHVVAVHMY